MFFFLKTNSLRLGLWESLKLKVITNIKEKLFISSWSKSWVCLDILSGAQSLLGCFHLTCHSLLTLPWAYLTWRQFQSSALPPLSSSLLPSHHTLFSQGIFGRIDRNYSKNRIFISQAVACHLVPSWFTGGFELPRLATQEATANRVWLIQLSKTEEFGMTGWKITFFALWYPEDRLLTLQNLGNCGWHQPWWNNIWVLSSPRLPYV